MKYWTLDELRLALALYCQIPFGSMHSKNKDVILLSEKIDRTPSSVAMKLVNFASLDPQIIASGRKGLGNASSLDKAAWDELHKDWERGAAAYLASQNDDTEQTINHDENTSQKSLVEVRLKQSLFRRIVLSSYNGACCITGISDRRLLVASHIVPWSVDTHQRLNPANGLCLSALHDKAFDRGLITILPNLKIKTSKTLQNDSEDSFIFKAIISFNGCGIRAPEKFYPQDDFLKWHNNNIFIP